MDTSEAQVAHTRPRLKEIAYIFLKLGTTAFGGPAAHLAMMQDELVRRRKWLNQENFLDLISAANLIPGPNSTEVAIHVGHKMRGWPGLIVAGISFIFPAFLIVWAIAWFYVHFGSLPTSQAIFTGIKPVILAVIGQAIWSLSRTAIKDKILAIFGVGSLALYLIGYNEILILLFVAVMNLAFQRRGSLTRTKMLWLGIPTLLYIQFEEAAAQVAQNLKVPLESVFLFFAKVGSVLFGSGYVLIAFLQSDLVDRLHWITEQQLLDAVAVGQFTPGPVFTTATFIGYLVSGNYGAIAATVGIFLPAFFFVAATAPFLPTLRRSSWAAPLLDGLNVASLSLMAGAGLLLAKSEAPSIYSVIVFAMALILLIRFKINSAWLVLIGGFLGAIGLARF